MSKPAAAAHELKQRVFTCLDRLSDRDTLAAASAELDLIVRSLSPETSLSPFISCLLAVDSAHKTSVRAHSVRLFASLAAVHGHHLSPYLPKIVSSSLLRRLKDSDTAVRSACSDVSASLARDVASSNFKLILDPLMAALLIEQDYNVQIGSALCLSAAIDSSESVDAGELRRFLPKLVKLAKTDSFRAKPALLALLASIVAADGGEVVNGPGLMASVVACLTELLSSEDWAARKAAAEALQKVALGVSRRELVAQLKKQCISALENRRFDKVKIARESMNKALEAWKEVGEMSEDDSPLSRSHSSSSKDLSRNHRTFSFETPRSKKTFTKSRSSVSDCSTITGSPSTSSFETPQSKRTLSKCRSSVSSMSDDSTVTTAKRSPQTASDRKSSSGPVKKPLDRKLDLRLPLPRDSPSTAPAEVGFEKYTGRFGSGNVPSEDIDDSDGVVSSGGSIEQDFEDISLIRRQLVQIERQQSDLMQLLQTFMGSSQSGINSLETRVSGLEKALDGISHNLALQSGRISNESTANSCCMLPGAEFLSPKFWRKNEGFSQPDFNHSLVNEIAQRRGCNHGGLSRTPPRTGFTPVVQRT